MSGAQWVEASSQTGMSFIIRMADLGYDVYIGNNRGTKYSQDHTTYAYNSSEYWDYTLDGYAEDLLANMNAAYSDSGNKTGVYYGYSLGTVQMMIALTKYEDQLQTLLDKVVLMAPCTTMGPVSARPFESFSANGVLKTELEKAGVNAIFGPNWDLDTICANSSVDVCTLAGWASNFPEDQQIPLGLKLDEHIYQLFLDQTFRPYVSDWENRDQVP